ncbi:autotransporter outer membrane beta-barrel domain-containing protein [Aquabacter spiritensis]|nr:autotransporter outer membrane beta-barrel domain-containing protein [Aquabacter spiritensis]
MSVQGVVGNMRQNRSLRNLLLQATILSGPIVGVAALPSAAQAQSCWVDSANVACTVSATAVSVDGNGTNGANSDDTDDRGGPGNPGAAVAIVNPGPLSILISGSANGGNGGEGYNAGFFESASTGGNGGTAGSVTVTNSGAITALAANPGAAIFATAIGGTGGKGGDGSSDNGGEPGGLGNTGGTVRVTNTASISTAAASSAGIFAIASGGVGGIGGGNGGESFSGPSSKGGTGGTAAIVNSASVTTQSNYSIALLAVAAGGAGGAGSGFKNSTFSYGSGGAGGNAYLNSSVAQQKAITIGLASASVNNSGALTTNGKYSSGIWVFASGGAGGPAGNQTNYNGGAAGNGGGAYAVNSGAIVASGDLARGVGAVANGGAGGAGGYNGPLPYGGGYSYGGAGGSGGNAGVVTIRTISGSSISASGTGSNAVYGGAVGGAGGAAGYGADFFYSNQGGAGGAGGTVFIYHSGVALTNGASAAAIYANASGGAAGVMLKKIAGYGGLSGGNGGYAKVQAALAPGPNGTPTTQGANSPGVLVNVAGGAGGVGRNGGSGGSGGTATVYVSGTIATTGDGSIGISVVANGGTGGAAQVDPSGNVGVGGGGGTAGSATVTSKATISTQGYGASGIAVSTMGGSTGTSAPFVSPTNAGDGGSITLHSYGAITATNPQMAGGILVNSSGGTAYTPGKGGKGGNATVFVYGSVATYGTDNPPKSNPYQVMSPAISVVASGGAGGTGTVPNSYVNIGPGGAGGTIAITVKPLTAGTTLALSTQGNYSPAIYLSGSGGNGGTATYNIDYVNNGGPGGAGSNITATVGANVTISTHGVFSPGIQASSIGGNGGNGAGGTRNSLAGGNGGNGGAAGVITITNSANIATTGLYSPAIQAQSAGGNAGNGADGDDDGGDGGAGGTAAAANGYGVSVVNFGNLSTQRSYSSGISVSSLGGNGGIGGDGGDKGGAAKAGGTGGDAYAANHGTIQTSGDNSSGILGISIGGGGATGGSADAAGLIVFATGGAGGPGAAAGVVNITNYETITTSGMSSNGISAFSMGGGGGIGGSVSSFSGSFGFPTVNITVGGKGGSGAFGGTITLTNYGDITTSGFDSAGLRAFTAGGAGGAGGSASSTSFSLGFYKPLPSINVGISIGGGGGTGGNGGNVNITNVGSIITTADQASGIFALSIGGGGGDGGNATTNIYSYGTSPQIDISVSIGGSGGSGGNGGNITLANNDGTISTLGFAADGLQAVSIGGGGGNGGTGTSYIQTTLPVVGQYLDYLPIPFGSTYSASVSIGGDGGSGGVGGNLTLSNSMDITTAGIDARGIVAQSIGGGGGIAAAGQGSSSATMTINVNVGGNGGGGGNGGTVQVTNEKGATITTMSDGAHGIFAQSVGGSGGSAGTSSADAFDSELTALGQLVVNNLLEQAISYYAAEAAHAIGLHPDFPASVSLSVAIGGKGGGGGKGGDLTIQNFGNIFTGAGVASGGDVAIGIFAQSIGGGGGVGGHASVAGARIVNGDVALGGNGGAYGKGGTVSVTSSGAIITEGDSAFGILAQSIGGGGGIGGLATGASQLSMGSSLSLGGALANNADGSGGGTVTISSTLVSTAGVEAHAIVGQSVGGGGGLAFLNPANSLLLGQASYQEALLAQFETYFPIGPYNTLADMQTYFESQVSISSGTLTLTLGGTQASSSQANGLGGGNTVTITNEGTIATTGVAAFGILAQSIGGGGGFATDGGGTGMASLTVTGSFGNKGDGSVDQSGGAVVVQFAPNSSIETSGAGATAVVAQSIGGGGGYTGAIDGTVPAYQTFMTSGAGFGLALNANTGGGPVTLTSLGATTITTTGANAHGLFAQSLSGGGGLVGTAGSASVPAGILMPSNTGNTTRGTGYDFGSGFAPGAITVVYEGSISTSGAGSVAIFAQSGVQGTSGAIDRTASTVTSGAISITVGGGTIAGGSGSGAAIMIDGGGSNTITVNSNTVVGAASSLAIFSPWGDNTVNNSGTVVGNVTLATDGATTGSALFNNLAGGTFITAPAGTIDLGTGTTAGSFSNQGSFVIAGTGQISTATVTGTFTQTTSGMLMIDVDASGTPTADLLTATAVRNLNGFVYLSAVNSLLPQSYTVLAQTTTTVPLTTAIQRLSIAQAPGTYLPVAWTGTPTDTTLSVSPQVNFLPQNLTMTPNQLAYAQHLQASWNNGGGGLGPAYADLVNLTSAASYLQALTTGSPTSVAAGPIARMTTSREALGSVLSCPHFAATGTLLEQGECTWARIDASVVNYTPSDLSGFTASTLTYRIGAQKEIAPGWFFGASAAYNAGWFDADSGYSTSDGQGVDIAASLKREIGPWLFSGAVHAGYATYDLNRQTVLGTTSFLSECGYDVYTVSGRFRVEYEIPFEYWYLRPYGQLDVVYAYVPGFSEGGSGPFNLAMSQSDNLLFAYGPFVEFGGRFDLEDGTVFRPYATVGATFLSNSSWQVDAALQNAPIGTGNFTTVVDMPDVLGDFGIGLQWMRGDSLEFRLNYATQVGTDYVSHTGSARISYRF